MVDDADDDTLAVLSLMLLSRLSTSPSGVAAGTKMASATGGGEEVERVGGGGLVGLVGEVCGDDVVTVVGLVGGERGRKVFVVCVVIGLDEEAMLVL